MKKSLLILLSIGVCVVLHAQETTTPRILSSNLGSSGSSHTVETSQGTYYISQSIGQSSVIGTHYNNGYYLRQGYQQPLRQIKRINVLDISLKAKVYPNPFQQDLFISFSDTVLRDISVKVFDIKARLIHRQRFLPTQKVHLQLPQIASGTYYLNVASGNKQFNTKLIKN